MTGGTGLKGYLRPGSRLEYTSALMSHRVLVGAAIVLVACGVEAGEITLAEALERVSVAGREVRLARAAVAEARAAEAEVRSQRLPTFAITQSLTEIDQQTVDRANAAAVGLGQFLGVEIPPFVFGRSYRTEAQMQWSLWTAGRIGSGLRAAESRRTAVFADELATLRQARAAVVASFFTLAGADDVISARESGLERARRRLAESSNRLEVGLATRQEVLRWRVEVEAAVAALASAEADQFLARLDLAEQLSLSVRSVRAAVVPPPDRIAAWLDWADAVDAEAVLDGASFGHLPEAEAAEARVEAAEHRRRQARAGLMPRLDASATAGWLENETLTPDEFTTWSAGLVLTIPVDARGDQRARLRQADAQLEAATISEQQTESGLRIELGRALAELIRSRTRLRSAQAAVQEARASSELLARQHEVGLVSLLDLIDADDVTVGAEVSLAQARAAFLAAVASLELVWAGADPPFGGMVP